MSDAKRANFGPTTTADEVVDDIDLTAKTAVITGASGGLGAETARALARRGAWVTLAVRNVEKGQKVAEEIRRSATRERVDVLELELDALESVRRFAAEYRSRHDALSVLVNNAGVMACPLGRTREGYELQFGTNHLGHFLLTALLAPSLRAAAPARVISVSSGGHRFSPVVFEDIHYERRPYEKWQAYGQSKTANILFALELDRRMKDSGVRAFAVHPGTIITDLARHLSIDDVKELESRIPGGVGFQYKSVAAGAATACWAATAPELDGHGGHYLEDCRVSGPKASANSLSGYEPYAMDADAAARLWTVSEEMVGQRFAL